MKSLLRIKWELEELEKELNDQASSRRTNRDPKQPGSYDQILAARDAVAKAYEILHGYFGFCSIDGRHV